MATQQALIDKVANDLWWSNSGETTSPEDSAIILAAIGPKLDDLGSRLGVYIADSNSVSDAQLEWVARLVAQSVGGGRQFDPNEVRYAENQLLKQMADASYPPMVVEYF